MRYRKASRGPVGEASIFDLSGKTALVTGGGRGIGRGIARAFVRSGASVMVSGRSEDVLRSTCIELAEMGGRCTYSVADVTSAADVSRLAEAVLEFGGGRVDCWVNNAGGAARGDVGPLIDLTEEQWDSVVDTNLKWTFFACQTAARAMVLTGGSIINISSRSGSQPNPMTGQYGAAKAGLENLTATMAVEWGHMGIRVNAVAPGLVVTEANSGEGSTATESRRRRQIETVPLQRLGTVDDIGPMCVYLASDEAAWMTG